MNRIMNAIVPASVTRTMMAKMLEKSLATKSAARQTEAKRSKCKPPHTCCCIKVTPFRTEEKPVMTERYK